MNHAARMAGLLAACQPAMLDTLRAWVECESPSGDAVRLNTLSETVAAAFQAAGGLIRRHPLDGAADALQVDFPGRRPGPPVLLLGHLDTVYPVGTLPAMPFAVRDGCVHGPGVLDMKGGLVAALFALRVLHQAGLQPRRPVCCLFVPDEETGSHRSRPLTERVASGCAEVLVLEPAAAPGGACKTRRKGIALYRLSAHGAAAHAGLDFASGASAVVELARLVVELAQWSDARAGITVNPGVFTGGSRANVVAAEAALDLEIRAWTLAELLELDLRLRRLQPADSRVRLEIAGGINRPPMEPSAAGAQLFARAREQGRSLGLALDEAATGGGSDGNFTAALGIPTLDGLGMVGAGAHAPHEYFRLDQFVPRTALLAGLLAS